MRVLLDTVAFLFAVNSPERLSKRAASAISDESNNLEVSTLSLSEIAIKSARGRIRFSAEDVRRGIDQLNARLLAYSPDHAFLLFQLPLHHTDPFDRQIIAQALSEEVPILSPDREFGLYRDLRVIW